MREILKKIKSINVKGFTLVEMLGVIVIMGLILIVVFPTMSKMIHNNNNQEYSNYYDLVEEAAQVYAGKLTDTIGTSKYSGCATIELSTLIDEGYVQSFSDTKTTCTTGANDIVIRNDKGSITVKFQLNCTKDGELKYSSGENDNGVCEAYTMVEETNIKMKLDADDAHLNKVSDSGSNIVYIGGTSNNNYIWYSGKLWRIVSYNTSTEIVKAVTVDSITSIYYNSSGISTFSGSDIETWLNNDFLKSLKDSQNFLTSYNWNASANTNMNENKQITNSFKKLKVGLITTYEYGKIKGWYDGKSSWILSEGTSGQSVCIEESTIKTKPSTSVYGVRPAIVFSSDVLVHSGNGSINNPYIIDNSANAVGKSGEYINTRYSGEYVKVGSRIYRIVSTDGNTTKVIGTTSVGNNVYDTDHYDYASSDLKAKLESSLSTELSYATNGDFCLDTINSDNIAYQSSKCLTPSRVNNTIKIGLPKFGDLFTSNISSVGGNYWTLNPNTEVDESGQAYDSLINLINEDGTVGADKISSTHETVVVFYLDSSIKISGGSGTSSRPYTLTK